MKPKDQEFLFSTIDKIGQSSFHYNQISGELERILGRLEEQKLIRKEKSGLYHVTAKGLLSYFTQ